MLQLIPIISQWEELMTKYESLMNKSDEACLTAIKFAKQGHNLMATFWKNASNGYKEKALQLPIQEASKTLN